jgi:iron complex transport system substrate-binding protein
MRRSAWFALLLAALVLPGCSGKKESAQRPARPKTYRSVISLSPSTSEIWMTMANTTILKGRTASDDWPKAPLATIEVVSSVKPNYERIAQIKPDLIVYDDALFRPEEIEKIKSQTGADSFAITADSIDEFIVQMYDLGSLAAFESHAASYVSKIVAEKQAAASSPLNPKPKVAVLLAGDSGRDYIAGVKSFVASAVEAAGGTPVGPDSTKFEALSPEAFIALNPDVIIVGGTKENTKGAEAVAANPRYQTISAVKRRAIKIIDEDVLVRRGGRVDLLLKSMRQVIVAGARK